MKKFFAVAVAVLALSSFAAVVHAEGAAPGAPATTAPTPAATTAKPPSKMSTCAKQYHAQAIPKNQYRAFMSSCMKGQPYTPAAATAGTPTSTPPSTVPTLAPTSNIAPGNTATGVRK